MSDSATALLFEENDESAVELFLAMGDISKYQDKRLLAALSEIGVNPAQYSYLSELSTGERMNLRELAQRLHVKAPTACVTVKRMEKSGLVTRCTDPADSRVVWITITEKGRAQYLQARLILADYIAQVFGNISERDASMLYGLLCRIRENVKNYIPNLPNSLKLIGEGSL